MGERGGVFIGVNNPGSNMTPLQGAAATATEMHQWAITDGGMSEAHAKLLTDDDGGTVSRQDVYDAVCELIGDGPNVDPQVDQLFLYFTGHGVQVGGNETWLLTKSDLDVGQAINVQETITFAARGPVPHVVIFSDACRSDASGDWGNSLSPQPAMWRPEPRNSDEKLVDVFYACRPSFTALEVTAPEASIGLFSQALLNAIRGHGVDEVDSGAPLFESVPSDDAYTFMFANRLAKWLPLAVQQLEIDLKLTGADLPRPAYDRNADDSEYRGTWIARLAAQGTPPSAPTPPMDLGPIPGGAHSGGYGGGSSILPSWRDSDLGRGPDFDDDGADVGGSASTRNPARPRPTTPNRKPRPPLPPTLPDVADDLIQSLLKDRKKSLEEALSQLDDTAPGATALIATARSLADQSVASQHFSGDGITIRGGEFADAPAAADDVVTGHTASTVSCTGIAPATVVVTFTDGTGALVPVIPGFVSAITFNNERGAIDDISFEPSDSSSAREQFDTSRERIRDLRYAAAACALHGVLRVRHTSITALRKRAGFAGYLDPTTALYVAYAWSGACVSSAVAPLADEIRTWLHCSLYDLELLCGALTNPAVVPKQLIPFGPLFSQSWDLLQGLHVPHGGDLDNLKRGRRNTLWTVLNPSAADRARVLLTELT